MRSIPVDQLLVPEGTSIRNTLELIDRNGLGMAYVVDNSGNLSGLVTDGDIRRSLLGGCELKDEIDRAMVTDFTALPVTASRESQLAVFAANERIRIIPLLDPQGKPVDYASITRERLIPVAEPELTGNELNYVTECLLDNWISSQGPFVSRFEHEFTTYLGVPHALAVSNGTAALHVALASLGVGPGDEVIVPDLTFAATINTVILTGATPVIVDIDPHTWNMDVAATEAAVTAKTKAIMPVHLFGLAADMDGIMDLAERHGLLVIEDAAQGLGATENGRLAGTRGHAACFSFFGNKLITTGEGGMVVFRDKAAAERAKQFRDHGMDPSKRYWHTMIGFNYRMTNIQAAIGVAQLERIEYFITRKLAIAQRYREILSKIDSVILPADPPGHRNVYWTFSAVLDPLRAGLERDELIAKLRLAGVDSRPMFYPLHQMPPYRQFAGKNSYPNAARISANGFGLPSSTSLTVDDVDYICAAIKRILNIRTMALKAEG